jgi:O-succinylbenzoic acid--CoA ligase
MINNNLTPNFVHPRFKLNGFHFSADDLCRVAYSFIKEGDAFEKPIGIFILDWFDNKSHVQMQTSGTTGTPKTIEVSKQAMVNSAIATGDYFNVHEGTKALHCLPTLYVAGKMMLVRAFILGWDMDITEPTSNPLERNDSQYDFAAMVPLQAQQSITKLSQIKTLILGGAKVSSELARQLKSVPAEVYETYGMTETITHIAAKHIDESAFNTLPDVTVSSDSRGCLVIHAQNLLEEPVVTNDVVDIINQNHFIWLGRYDNVINSGGIKLYPEQIEEKLSPYISQRFFVKGVPDEALGEKLVLIVEGNKYDLNEEVYKDLDKYERPKEVAFADKFAETGSGKILRSEVPRKTSI